MSDFNLGFKYDLEGRYADAVRHYEAEIVTNLSPPSETYLNLAFIYWYVATEPPFVFKYQIPNKISSIGGERYPTIIEEGLLKYPRNVEFHFWRRYFPHILFGEDFSPLECEATLHEYGDKESIIPYFYLWLFDNNRFRDMKDQLLQQCSAEPTAKNTYIKSVLESKLKMI